MLGRVRRFFREESLGVTITVGVVVGLTLQQVVVGIVTGFEAAALRRGNDLSVTVLGIDFYYQALLAYAVAWAVLAALAWVLFVMPIAPDGEADGSTRDCPECKSEIAADATRCAFCTSPVAPLEPARPAE